MTATERELAERQATADRLSVVTERRRRVVREVEAEWRAAVLAALAAGLNGSEVGRLAGVKKERVYQIRDGRR